jgi:hypothetical protein
MELFAIRISPGLLEASMPLSRSEVEILLGKDNLSGAMKDAIRGRASEAGSTRLRLPLTNRRLVRAFASLVKAKSRLAPTAQKPAG